MLGHRLASAWPALPFLRGSREPHFPANGHHTDPRPRGHATAQRRDMNRVSAMPVPSTASAPDTTITLPPAAGRQPLSGGGGRPWDGPPFREPARGPGSRCGPGRTSPIYPVAGQPVRGPSGWPHDVHRSIRPVSEWVPTSLTGRGSSIQAELAVIPVLQRGHSPVSRKDLDFHSCLVQSQVGSSTVEVTVMTVQSPGARINCCAERAYVDDTSAEWQSRRVVRWSAEPARRPGAASGRPDEVAPRVRRRCGHGRR